MQKSSKPSWICTAAQDGDMIFFGADNKKIVADAMGALRLKVGKDLGLTDESKWAPLWRYRLPDV
ncbi:hypothetical protein ACLB1E_19735 [Escherichia coli]